MESVSQSVSQLVMRTELAWDRAQWSVYVPSSGVVENALNGFVVLEGYSVIQSGITL